MNKHSESDWDVVVVGAGAAGLLATIRAAEMGRRTLLIEKNRRPGVKILMSGGTRCNLTQATDNRGIIRAFGRQGNFLHSPLAAFSVQDTIDFFHACGLPTKTEETGKIFPVSDSAADVLDVLLKRQAESGAHLATEEPLEELESLGDGFRLKTPHRTLSATSVIVTTGGVSYPGSGTTGDGYRWAAQFGHTIVAPRPALTPITVDAPWVRRLQGISLTDAIVRVVENGAPAADGSERPAGRRKGLDERRGAMLFTHFGLSGPVILDCSRAVSGHPQPRSLMLECDLFPDRPQAALDEHLERRIRSEGRRQISGILADELPRRLAESLLELIAIDPARRAAEFGRRDLAALVDVLKSLRIAVTGTRGFKKAEVTAGGVDLDEVDSRTMQSKLAPGLYLAGEVLDLDGPIGGYNFQAAWSTGWLAGQSAGGK